MKIILHGAIRILAYVIVTLALAGFQTTVWYQIFGHFPSPLLWLIPCLFLSLYRSPFEALLSDYAIAFAISPFTVMPLGILLILLMLLTFGGLTLKGRIYWKGSRVFASYCFFSVIAFQILYTLLMWFFESRIIMDWAVLTRITELALTFLVAFPLYFIFSGLDVLLDSPDVPDLELRK